MSKIITHNFWIKMLCILIAVGVWVYVANSESKVDDFPGSVSIEVKNTPQELVVIKDVDFVQLRIVADRGLWKKLSTDTFEAYIDLAGLGEGIHEIPIRVNSNIEDVQIVQINPSKILIRLEPLVSKSVPVRVFAKGSAAEGYVPGEAIIEPENIMISGAKSIIDKISEATALVGLDGESEKIENKIVNLTVFNEKNEEIENIEFVPSQVKVELQIIRATQVKTVGIKVSTIGQPENGYWVSEITTDPATAIITGTPKGLSQTEYIETEKIDINGLSADKIMTVDLKMPSGVNLLNGQMNKIMAQVKISRKTSQRQIDAKFNYQNLPDNLKIVDVNPQNLTALISGSENELNQLDPNDVTVKIDLSDYGSGTFYKNIDYSIISVPFGLRIINFIPSAIKITLENK